MSDDAFLPVEDELLFVRPYQTEPSADPEQARRSFVVEAPDDATSHVLQSMLRSMGRLLAEKRAAEFERRMEETVDVLAKSMVSFESEDFEMAERLARRHARILEEFGSYTAEELGKLNGSKAGNPGAMADNWRKRRQVFAVPHPGKPARERDVYPAFQFSDDHKPMKVVQSVLEIFADRKTPWKIALWFTSNNGFLADSARPVDLLETDPQAIVQAARHEAQGSGI